MSYALDVRAPAERESDKAAALAADATVPWRESAATDELAVSAMSPHYLTPVRIRY